MLLDERTWVATYTHKDVVVGIATDAVSPPHIVPGYSLWNPENL